MLEAQVPVQPAGRVLVDDEPRQPAGATVPAGRLGRRGEVTLALVALEPPAPGTRRGSRRGDYQKARTALIADLIGRSAVTVKLRPAGRVALEWARLSAEA